MTRSIGDGLLALRTLMDTPAISAAVASGRDQFEDVLRQITTLGRYKGLHDQLQQLEDCARVIDQDRRRLPHDLRAWGDLARSEPDLHAKIDAVLGLAGDMPANALWSRKLERARQEARTGIEQTDLDLLTHAMDRIDDVLGSIPWLVNARLVEVAASLPLRALVENLAKVSAQFVLLKLNERATRLCEDFEQGVVALEQLDARLAQLVRRHNLFQELDNELRQLEIGLDPDVGNLARIWPDLQPLHQQVCDDQSVAWAPGLIATVTELEYSLAEPARQRTTMIFWRYRGQVSLSFNHVDVDLLRLCEELQGIGKSLDFVLRIAP